MILYRLILLAFFFAVSLSSVAVAKPLKIIATIPPLADIVAQVGGDLVKVTTLLKGGDNAHTFRPTPQLRASIESADALVMVGFDFEEWLHRLLESDETTTKLVIDCSNAVSDPIKIGTTNHHGDTNPHYWLDPKIMGDVAVFIGKTLSKKLPASEQELMDRAYQVSGRLIRLYAEIERSFMIKGRPTQLVAFHNSWDYFARIFEFSVAGVIERSPGQEPSAKHFASLIKLIKDQNIGLIITEKQFSSNYANTLANETGAKVISLDPVGTAIGITDYQELIRYNAGFFITGITD